MLLLGTCLAVPANTVSTAQQAPDLLHAAGVVNFGDAAVQAAAKADLDNMRSRPFSARSLARQFAHGIDDLLPHGSKTSPVNSEY